MSENQTPGNAFDQMAAGLSPVEDPGYLRYWDRRVERVPEDARVQRIVQGLTRLTLRGTALIGDRPEFADCEPALQARYWYRALGPLNPLSDVEPDMVRAAKLMYEGRVKDRQEEANLRLDTVYILADLARHSSTADNRRSALGLALSSVRALKESESFERQHASYRLQTLILEKDILHDALRLRNNQGDLIPRRMSQEVYRDYEAAFVRQELQAIAEFGQQVRQGITDENFGILFEWYFIMARRHEAWATETLDTVAVRGATSRENAEWTGEFVFNALREYGNHDIVVTTRNPDDSLAVERWQLKAVANKTQRFHPSVTILDYQAVLNSPFVSINSATNQLIIGLQRIANAYRQQY